MITFNKLVIISGNHYSIQTDSIDDINTLFSNITDVNTKVILVLNYGADVYSVDLGYLIVSNIKLLESANIQSLIAQLTPEMIYSYSSDLFVQNHVIRSFMSSDLPGNVTVTPCNADTGEITNTTYDPSCPDMMITCDQYKFTETFPIIDNKLRFCTWNAGNIIMENRVNLVRDTPEVTFLSFSDTTTATQSLKDVAANNWEVTPNTVVMLVLAGSLFYDVPYIYQTCIGKTTTLELNNSFIMDEFASRGYSTIDDVINDPDSFVIMVNTNRVLIRDLYMTHVTKNSNVHQFSCYERQVHDHHVDYVCIDSNDHTIHGITTVDELYRDVGTNTRPTEHQVYTNGGSGDMRLVQLAIC